MEMAGMMWWLECYGSYVTGAGYHGGQGVGILWTGERACSKKQTRTLRSRAAKTTHQLGVSLDM